MAKTKEQMKAQLAQMDDDWTPVAEPSRYIHPAEAAEIAARQKREAANTRAIAEQLAKESAQRRQYEETNRAFIANIIGQDDEVDRLKARVASYQAQVAELLQERLRVVTQLQALEQNAVVDLSTISMGELLKTAATRETTRSVEMGALVAVRDELTRRLADGEAGLVEAQHELLRLQRVALHHHCDLLITQLHGPVHGVAELFTELRKTEEAVREMGGPRQCFSNLRMVETLKHLVSNWDRELAEIARFSERYQS